MKDNQMPVGSQPHIQLDHIRSRLHGKAECRQRILRSTARAAPVGYDDHG